MKIVINTCYGGFNLSPEAELRLYELGMREHAKPVEIYYPLDKRGNGEPFGYDEVIKKWREYCTDKSSNRRIPWFLTTFSPDEKFILYGSNIPRDNPLLIQVVEEMGEKANGSCAKLTIKEIPDDVNWQIEEYDGSEHIAEAHRTW